MSPPWPLSPAPRPASAPPTPGSSPPSAISPVARRVDRLNYLADELREADTAVEVPPAGLGLRSDLATVTDRLAAGDVRLLISNAGASGYAKLANVGPSEADRLLTLNAMASVQ